MIYKALCIALSLLLSVVTSGAERIFLKNWTLETSLKVEKAPESVSTLGFDDSSWLNVTVPTTVLNALVKAEVYPDPRVDMNNFLIPDVSDEFNERLGLSKYSHLPLGANPWKEPWWYRTEFTLRHVGKHIFLNFDGLNYRADIYLNGHLVATADSVVGMFRRFRFEVTDYVKKGRNCLAVRIHQVDHPGTPTPGTQFILFGPNRGNAGDGLFLDETMKMSGGWDCAPVVRDRNMGIYQDVFIENTGDVDVLDPFVQTVLPDNDTLKAELRISAKFQNLSSRPQKGRAKAKIYLDGVKIAETSLSLSLEAGEDKCLNFKPVIIESPKLWWPNGYGEAQLHHLEISFADAMGGVSDKAETDFGIREVKSYLMEKEYAGSDGEICKEYGRVFEINGQRIFARGGWLQPDALLDNSPKNIADQAMLLREAGVNLVGSEDMPSPSELWLNSWDKSGLMSWHVFHQCYRMFPGRANAGNPLDHSLAAAEVRDIILRYRNHPGIIAWFGVNEVMVTEDLYLATKQAVEELDPSRIFVPTTSVSWDVDALTPYIKDQLPLGTTDDGAPDYNWAPSEYYFNKVDEVHLQMFRNELGMPSMPSYNSLKKFIGSIEKPFDVRDRLFPLDSVWAEHGAWDVNNFCWRGYDNAIRTSYLDPVSASDYVRKGEMVSAEGYRAMIEAANHRMWDVTSGVMLWKLNSCWPDVCWQIYDWYLTPTAAYYFAKKSLEPVHIQMNSDDMSICVVNTTGKDLKSLVAKVTVTGNDMKDRWNFEQRVDLKRESYAVLGNIAVPSDVPAVYFVRMSLCDASGKEISNNLYWRYSQHQSFAWLSYLPKTELQSTTVVEDDGDFWKIRLDLENTSDNLSFFNRLSLSLEGEEVQPVFWSDNYLSLFPGEHKSVVARVQKLDLQDIDKFRIIIE